MTTPEMPGAPPRSRVVTIVLLVVVAVVLTAVAWTGIPLKELLAKIRH